MARQASPIEKWEDETVGFKQPILIITGGKVKPGEGIPPEGVDEVLDSAAEMVDFIGLARNMPPLLDVIPMSELERSSEAKLLGSEALRPIVQPKMSSSVVEFIGIENLDRAELDQEEHDQPTPPPYRAPFGSE